MHLTPDQITKLNQLGIKSNDTKSINSSSSPFVKGESVPRLRDEGDLKSKNLPSTIYHQRSIFPLLSISGLTLLSFSGLILFKNKAQEVPSNSNSNYTLPETSVSPTQVPKSIQHYLLTSQQYFTQASQNQSVDDLNQAILAATTAIKEFPNDYRGFYQRGRIYQSVLASQPQLASQVISDLSQAQKLEPNNAEITRSLASAYAQNGDAKNTINYLSQTIALEPTKAQNFYDLALIQQQVGYLPQAIETYNQLITIISDPNQKAQVESEKSSLEKLLAQSPTLRSTINDLPSSSPTIYNLQPTISFDSPTIQASLSNTGLIIAAPEEIDQVKVSNLTTSNSLSGQDILPAGTKEININNSQVISSSQVYVTITKGGKNQNLQVVSKSNGSFIVGLDKSINEDIEFNWWIIN